MLDVLIPYVIEAVVDISMRKTELIWRYLNKNTRSTVFSGT